MLVINFHGIGEFPRSRPADEAAYWLATDRFYEALDVLGEEVAPDSLLLTFDDGNVSDFTIAYPEIIARGLTAKTFVLSSRIGASGLDLDAEQIKTLDANGFTVGLHGREHLDWRSLKAVALRNQLEDGQKQLQQILGRRVDEVAVPFGSYSGNTLGIIREAGFRRIYTSDKYPTLFHHAVVPRYTISRYTDFVELRDFLSRARKLYSRSLGEIRYLLKSARRR